MNKASFVKLTLALYKVTDLFPEGEPLRNGMRNLADEILADLILLQEGAVPVQKTSAGTDSTTLFWYEPKSLNPRVENLFKNFEMLENFLTLGELKGLADKRNFLVLKREYGIIIEQVREKLNLAIADFEEAEEEEIEEKITVPDSIYPPEEKEDESSDSDELTLLGPGTPESYPQEEKTGLNAIRQKKILEILEKSGKIKVGDLVQVFPDINRRTIIRDLEELAQDGFIGINGGGRGRYYEMKARE